MKGEHHGTDIHRNNDTKPEKKEQVLDKIIELDTVQKNQLEDPNLTPDDFDDVVEQKSKLIEQLDNLDSGFEKAL